nr:hypothetical protein [Tanacetum cinerariifolium]
MVLAYKTRLKSVEERLELLKKNKFIYLEGIKVLKVEIQMKDIAIKKLKRKLKVAQKEKDIIQLTVEKLKKASKSLNKLIDCQIVDNCKKGLGYESYNAVPPLYTGNFLPPKPDLSFTGMLVQNPVGKGSALPTDPQHTPIILQSSSSQPQKTQKPRNPKRKNTQIGEGATTPSSLEAEQDNGNIDKTQSKAIPNEASSPGTTSGGGFRHQDTMRDTTTQTRVLGLEKTKTTKALEINGLKKRVKKLEKKQMSRTHKLKRLYKVGLTSRLDSSEDKQSLGEDASKQGRIINDINADEDITLVNDQDDAEMFNMNDLHGEEINAASEVNAAIIATTVSAAATITTKEITLAQALVEIKTSKPKAKGIVLQEPTTIDADYQMAERLQAEEQQELTDEEKATFFMQLLEKKKVLCITTTGTRVKTVSESYYCKYKEVNTAQVKVSAAQKLQRNIISVYNC